MWAELSPPRSASVMVVAGLLAAAAVGRTLHRGAASVGRRVSCVSPGVTLGGRREASSKVGGDSGNKVRLRASFLILPPELEKCRL